ncbi:hypothetical protein CSH63_32955 [Micromonospora tulbaghiae]|uniref:Uncharacterized protein n=1 Tax=Micromonospora tulbaghiae TaxID=479978 RepID=A0A386WUL7_9ACTN|nr:hypothetical protein [Micromonospora tulbaghiae]AYF32165.1 hypothetical protein CSH63_32955 [Micromonospora tulbaghiae]
MTGQQSAARATDADEPGHTPDPLTSARSYLDRYYRLTRDAVAKKAAGFVHPQEESQWRLRQDSLLELARTSAVVSIAESLAVLAAACRDDEDGVTAGER